MDDTKILTLEIFEYLFYLDMNIIAENSNSHNMYIATNKYFDDLSRPNLIEYVFNYLITHKYKSLWIENMKKTHYWKILNI